MSTISYRIQSFIHLSDETILEKLASEHALSHIELSALQRGAWEYEINHLKEVLSGEDGRIIFEYSISGLKKVIDVVLLLHGKIFVLEYKVGATHFLDQDKRQALGYALRLKYFHSTSNDNWIIPILIATNAPTEEHSIESISDDMVFKTILSNSDQLKSTISQIDALIKNTSDDSWEDTWETGVYKASPTIINAARKVWCENNVRGFSLGEANFETRLSAEKYITDVVVPETKSRAVGKNKSICFVTGVPGAGKTLVGLNISVALQHDGASMLSGNGPLVSVLSAALQKDLKENKGNLVTEKEEASVESIIRDAYGYKTEIFDKRLNYTPGLGKVSLKENARQGTQHVIIFDEAQRAWDKDKMIKPGQTGRKYWQEDAFPFSEPGLLLWDLNQNDWGVFVCLVGGGQEINTGESGICEWMKVIATNPDYSDWHVYLADAMKGAEYERVDTDGRSIEDYRQQFFHQGRLTINNSLHLTACQRSNRSDKVAAFVQALLDCDSSNAALLYSQIKDKYHIYLTRDLDTARNKVRERQKDLSQRVLDDGQDDEIRIGMLMSSKAARMRPLGYEIKKVSQFRDKVPNWFLGPSDNVGSSNFLEIALNEFFVQGLELDFDVVMWDADFRYNPGKKDWDYYTFNDRYWSPVNKEEQEIKRFYMKNAYRVLLTRARAGMVIFVPKGFSFSDDGEIQDLTRLSYFYDCTYEYLRKLGLEVI